jgi:hypothetical protein
MYEKRAKANILSAARLGEAGLTLIRLNESLTIFNRTSFESAELSTLTS